MPLRLHRIGFVEAGCNAPGRIAFLRAALQRACEAIERAPFGQQEITLAHESYNIGDLVGGGYMPRTVAINCLINSGLEMPSQAGPGPSSRSMVTRSRSR